MAEVFAALAYYYDNVDAMGEREARLEEIREESAELRDRHRETEQA